MFTKPKGTKDLIGNQELIFSFVERLLIDIASLYNFSRIRTPIFESKDLFVRTTGEETEIVKKEMYEFKDKKGRELALKPEGTAPTIRAFIENKLYALNPDTKLYYLNSMYRYERPQKGRQREFYQFGVEYIGDKNVLKDIELIKMSYTILNALKIKNYRLEINSLGSSKTQSEYTKLLKEYFNKNIENLGEDAKSRLETNPLRILDDKKEMDKPYYKGIPSITECYSLEDKNYFNAFLKILNSLNIEYVVNEKLVRGLDYYSDVIFEFIDTNIKSAQSTFIGGGRYGNLVSKLGGPEISGAGFAIGMERLINNIEPSIIKIISKKSIDVYVANISADTKLASFTIVELLRNSGLKTEGNLIEDKLKKLFQHSEKLNPKFIIIVAPKEMVDGKVVIKNQITKQQENIKIENISEYILNKIGEK
jgi:histidyl-tRNA synthetase